ncbi:MAG: DNA helicase [Gemmatimonadales bacterium]|nr:MAG: DNA helicase [Gemmatimonadales bacterium]
MKGGRGRLRRVLDLLQEFYDAPHRGALARAKQEEDDLFMLLVFSEMMGVPNPASYHTLELLPLLYEEFHAWHLRMGMERSPLDHIRCC